MLASDGSDFEIVVFDEGVHDITEMTKCIRAAYKLLSDMGLRYWATHQDEKDTLKRATKGLCFLALNNGKILGTIAYHPPHIASGCSWYDRNEIAAFHQFAVWPDLQEVGIGSALLQFVEDRARDDGAEELALDTAEPATHLISMYEKRGYRFIEYADWESTNYRSVIMSKKL
ncbi:GNAT family N-acetyltransferase [Planctomycetota bacterium]